MGQEHTRACMVCNSWFVTEIKADGTYTDGYYFGTAPIFWASFAEHDFVKEVRFWAKITRENTSIGRRTDILTKPVSLFCYTETYSAIERRSRSQKGLSRTPDRSTSHLTPPPRSLSASQIHPGPAGSLRYSTDISPSYPPSSRFLAFRSTPLISRT